LVYYGGALQQNILNAKRLYHLAEAGAGAPMLG